MKNQEISSDNQEEQNQEAFPGTDESDKALEMGERFGLQLEGVTQHYVRAYNETPNASRDPKEVKRAIREFLDDKGLFVPTTKDKSEYNNPNFADDALEKTLRSWRGKAVEETLSMLQLLGKVDEGKSRRFAGSEK